MLCAQRTATVWVMAAENDPCFFCDACSREIVDESVAEFGAPPSPELRAATLAHVRDHREITFVELAEFLIQRDVPVDGDYAIVQPDDPSLIIWPGMSAEMLGLVVDLLNAGALVTRMTSVETYLSGGIFPTLPVAWPSPDCRPDGVPQAWLPVVLALPRPRPSQRRRRRLAKY
jgi:hypothetical protein